MTDSYEPEFVPRKIVQFRAAADANEWQYVEDWFNEDYRVKAWRDDGEERILLIWRERYFSGEESYYELINVRKKSLANQAEAIRFIKAEPDYTFARDEDGKKSIITNVYDFSDVTDKEVCASLAGRRITWMNRLTQEYETGSVPPRGKLTAIGYGNEGLVRFITFADFEGEGFRSVDLSRIVKIK
jgi:hypothetical protein